MKKLMSSLSRQSSSPSRPALRELPIPINVFVNEMVPEALMLLPANMRTGEARAMIGAIALQESRLAHRRQMNNGPATGLLQFERGGGVHAINTNASLSPIAAGVCDQLGVPFTDQDVWKALETNDTLAICYARILLLSIPKPLPKRTQAQEAWDQYLWAWRPGKPHRNTWDAFYHQAWENL